MCKQLVLRRKNRVHNKLEVLLVGRKLVLVESELEKRLSRRLNRVGGRIVGI